MIRLVLGLAAICIVYFGVALSADARPDPCRGWRCRTPSSTIAPVTLTPTATPKPACAAPTLDAEEQQFVAILNATRTANGVGALAVNDALSSAAQRKADRIALDPQANYNHNDFPARLRDCGYLTNTWLWEVLAIAQCAAIDAINVWSNSTTGHALIFTEPLMREVGVGRAYDPVHDWCPWVAEIGGP